LKPDQTGVGMSEENKIGGLKEREALKAHFNALGRVYPTTAEEVRLEIELEKSRKPNPDNILVDGRAPINKKSENSPKEKEKKERENRFRDFVWLNLLQAVHEQIERLSQLIDELREEIEEIHTRLNDLAQNIEERKLNISEIDTALRNGTIPRNPDGTLKDKRLNARLTDHLLRNDLPVSDLSRYSNQSIRGYLDAERDYQREALEKDRQEQQLLSDQADEKTGQLNTAMAERERLQKIVRQHNEITDTMPEDEQEAALESLYNGLDNKILMLADRKLKADGHESEEIRNKNDTTAKQDYREELKNKNYSTNNQGLGIGG